MFVGRYKLVCVFFGSFLIGMNGVSALPKPLNRLVQVEQILKVHRARVLEYAKEQDLKNITFHNSKIVFEMTKCRIEFQVKKSKTPVMGTPTDFTITFQNCS